MPLDPVEYEGHLVADENVEQALGRGRREPRLEVESMQSTAVDHSRARDRDADRHAGSVQARRIPGANMSHSVDIEAASARREIATGSTCPARVTASVRSPGIRAQERRSEG